MTKQQRKDLYYAAMFEVVAFDYHTWQSLDRVFGRYVTNKDVPEICKTLWSGDPLTRLSNAIDLCELKLKK